MNRNMNLNAAAGFTGLLGLGTKIALAVACLALGASSALATVIPIVHYRGGENDPGAVAGGSANATTVDYTPNMLDATLGGSANYTGSTPYAPSQLAYDFPGSVSYTRSPVTTAQDNWGLETWIRFDGNPTANTVLYIMATQATADSGFTCATSAERIAGIPCLVDLTLETRVSPLLPTSGNMWQQSETME